MLEQRLAQVGDEPFAQPGAQIHAHIGGDRHRRDSAQHQQQRLIKKGRVALGKAAIDQLAQHLPQDQSAGGADDKRDARPGNAPAVRAQKGPQPQQRLQIALPRIRRNAGRGVDIARSGIASLSSWIEHEITLWRGASPYRRIGINVAGPCPKSTRRSAAGDSGLVYPCQAGICVRQITRQWPSRLASTRISRPVASNDAPSLSQPISQSYSTTAESPRIVTTWPLVA